jgi:PAS domain S-box-containing protein
VGDIAGITLMAPLLLGWADKIPHLRPRLSVTRVVEGLGLLIAVAVVSWLAIQGELKWNTGLKYLVFPLFGWAAFRFEVRGVSVCALAVALVFVPVLSADLRQPEPGRLPPAVILLITQAFLIFTASVGLLLAAGLAERRRAATALRESESRFRSLFEHSLAGVALHEIVTDDAGKPVDYVFLMVNRTFEAQSGLASQNLVGQPITKVIPNIAEAPFIETYGRVALTGEPIRFEEYVPQLDRHFDICAFSPEPGQFATVFFDITPRKQTEAALQARNEELVRFTYTVSHDLKSPLVTIQTFLGFLEKDIQAADAARIETDLGHIRAAGSKMARLLDELLELSRIGRKANPPETAPLQKLVSEALELVAGRIAQRNIRVQVTDLPVRLHGDLARLVELYQNLIDNAAKFMGDQAAPCIEIGATTTGGEITLFVRDNGLGIDPRHRHKLFGLFEKLHPGTEGTGIGLALVKRIVEVHGGRISVESAGPGQGATFRFTLAKTTLAPHPSPSV